MAEFGIESLKDVIKFPIALTMDIVDALEDDNKITLSEWMSLAPGTVINLIKMINNLSTAGKEFKDLDEEEIDQLVNYIADMVDLEDEDLEAVIEQALVIVAELNKLRLLIIELKKDEE